MKARFFEILFLILAVSCSGGQSEGTRSDRILSDLNDPNSDKVLVITHRGDWRNFPENSVPAIESVIRMGADIVEIDLKMTKDSVLVLCHDKKLDRTTTGKGLVSDYTLSEIKSMRLKRAHGVVTDSLRMPTLEEALAVCKDRILVNLDHAWDYYDAAMAVVDRLNMSDQVLMKGKKSDAEVREKLSGHEHNMMYMPIVDINKPQGKDLFAEYLAIGLDTQVAYEVCWRTMDNDVRRCMEQIVRSGSKLWVNTLWASLCGGLDDDAALEKGVEEVYGQVISFGAKMIQTDRPELLLAYLRARGLHD